MDKLVKFNILSSDFEIPAKVSQWLTKYNESFSLKLSQGLSRGINSVDLKKSELTENQGLSALMLRMVGASSLNM